MRNYDFALSFAKEDRQHAERLADLLEKGGVFSLLRQI